MNMHLTLHPQRGLPGQPETTIAVSGETIIINGTPYDLSAVASEAVFEQERLFIGPVRRIDGALHVEMIVQLGDTAAPNQAGPWVIEGEGFINVPAARRGTEDD